MGLQTKLSERIKDVRAAIVTLPSAETWGRCLLVYGAFVACALPLGLASGFFKVGPPTFTPASAALLAFYVFLRPTLLEELVFRALLLPRNTTHISRTRLALISSAALTAFVASHPLNGWLLRPAAFALFSSPIFLTIAALLGAACILLYFISRSLWPPVLLHWSAVLIWITLLGGQGLVGTPAQGLR
jgi:uncharacterized protein